MTTTNPVLLFLPLFACLILPCKAKDKDGGGGGGALIKGMFVFGSSLVDNGNNNFLPTENKLNYLPYGIDFYNGPSGRASNGKNVIDFLGDQLKLPLIPPFYDPSTKGPKLINGVDFASAGSGILDDTMPFKGNATNLSTQIKNFETVTLPELEVLFRRKSSDFLSKYLFVVGTGGNDYLFNYFSKTKPIKDVNPGVFAMNLANLLSQKLQKLYSLGGRKFVLISIYPMGCIPLFRPLRMVDFGCLQPVNTIVELFNAQLKHMVDVSKEQMPGSTFVYVNSYKIIYDIIKDFASKGFQDVKTSCCELDRGGCKRGGEVCAQRNKYIFFDALHPTEIVNMDIATKAFNSGDRDEVYPINISQLALS